MNSHGQIVTVEFKNEGVPEQATGVLDERLYGWYVDFEPIEQRPGFGVRSIALGSCKVIQSGRA
jgi:hypothetical protein